ncbi:MAG: hypothetical protein J6C96_06140 [Oscillospiraceae bacterium]|nr:hypothetical protein [Oscillospiraceae bacterium]
MKKARIFTMVLCIAAAVISAGFINILGGIGFCFFVESNQNTYSICGICLFISSFFLILGTIFACIKKFWIPLIFNIIGTAFYIYTLSVIYGIPNNVVPKQYTELLAERHLITVSVTVLLLALTLINFMLEENVNKRMKKKADKLQKQNRRLIDEEKIL